MQNNNYNEIKKYISEKFKEKLKNDINNETAESIYNKGFDIVEKMFSLQKKENAKKFLMVGKIQSGKTINFISVIINAFVRKDINLFIVFTSFDHQLREQTVERIKDSINHDKSCENHLRIYSHNEIKSLDFSEKLIRDIERKKLNIIVLLKNSVKKINEIFIENDFLKNYSFLIIDDEGDLGSMTHDRKKDAATHKDFIELLKETKNSLFLSVTATPQVHLIASKNKYMKPDYHFTIDPGKGYIGLEYFCKNKDKYFYILDSNNEEWWKNEQFKKSVLFYLITATKLFQKNVFDHSSHSNMLIHTNRKNKEHYKYDDIVYKLINHYKDCLKMENRNDLKYKKFISNLNEIIKDFNLLDIDLDDNFLKDLMTAFELCDVKVINQKNNQKNTNNSNQYTINIGSALVERGITFDNLLTTFFTIRPKKTVTIDTLLQRARWFGYRTNILDDMKIFSTKKIIEDFDNTNNYNEEIWKKLKEVEVSGEKFSDVSWPSPCSSILKATSKAPSTKIEINNYYYISEMNFLLKKVDVMKKLLRDLLESEKYFLASNLKNSEYKFKCINVSNFLDIYKKYIKRKEFMNIIGIDDEKLTFIESKTNYKIRIVLLQNDKKLKNENNVILFRERKCIVKGNKYEIETLFQGRSDEKDNNLKYVGDANFNKVKNEEDTIFIQVHCIKTKESKNKVFPIALILPKKLIDEFNKTMH